MTRKLVCCLLALVVAPAFAEDTAVKSLFRTDVEDVKNQEIVVVEVTFPPGATSSSHRHNAHTVVYVLEGKMVLQVKGGEPRTVTPGEVFYEMPDDVHTVATNPSETEPAKVLVYFLKEKGAPTTVPAS